MKKVKNVCLTADEARVILDLLHANDCEPESEEKINRAGAGHVDMSDCELELGGILMNDVPAKSLEEQVDDWEQALWEHRYQ